MYKYLRTTCDNCGKWFYCHISEADKKCTECGGKQYEPQSESENIAYLMGKILGQAMAITEIKYIRKKEQERNKTVELNKELEQQLNTMWRQ